MRQASWSGLGMQHLKTIFLSDLSKLPLVCIRYWISKATILHYVLYFPWLANGVFHHINDIFPVVLSAFCKQTTGVDFVLPVRKDCYCLSPCREVSPLDCCLQHQLLYTADSRLHSFPLPADSDSVIHWVLEALLPYIWLKYPSTLPGPT